MQPLNKWIRNLSKICKLKNKLNLKGNYLEFIGYTLDLCTGRIYDKILGKQVENPEILYKILAHYSEAEIKPKTGKLINFTQLPGGISYEKTYRKRAIKPIIKIFSKKPETIWEKAKILNATKLNYGDYSIEIPILPGISIIYIIWMGDEEIPPSATILYDSSIINTPPTEDIAVLTEITTKRLIQIPLKHNLTYSKHNKLTVQT